MALYRPLIKSPLEPNAGRVDVEATCSSSADGDGGVFGVVWVRCKASTRASGFIPSGSGRGWGA